MNLHIAKWGNSLAVRIPKEYIRRTGLKEGDTVQANVKRMATLDEVFARNAKQRKIAAVVF